MVNLNIWTNLLTTVLPSIYTENCKPKLDIS